MVATRTESLTKADQRQSLQRLVSPVSGKVNEVSVTTLGEVADAGQALVSVVPEGEALIVEAFILNRDVGFVRRGARTIVKLEAYPFTRYGSLEGWWSIFRPTRSWTRHADWCSLHAYV